MPSSLGQTDKCSDSTHVDVLLCYIFVELGNLAASIHPTRPRTFFFQLPDLLEKEPVANIPSHKLHVLSKGDGRVQDDKFRQAVTREVKGLRPMVDELLKVVVQLGKQAFLGHER